MDKKIKVKTQWDEKYLRETLWMPFGSMCNFLGQAYQGKGISDQEFEEKARIAFKLALEFTETAYNRSEKQKEKEVEVPVR